ncbi:dual specificity protein phosphatase CDC14AB-like isoform X2 [Cydia pomonella]|uniref:dual specificity protein phosphatase CDC14AB-like isoform X2 n=1 Tax=Cydia pomonella TaxID=82600 RepID=UPI002ADE88C7|nr:dual specificity protein phosphatase CDC14AB-like isoform X2 [Cydia pomonella]
MMSRGNEFVFKTEYIKNILYFATLRQDKQIRSTPDIHYFSIDNELVYENYFSDFGPLNLGCVYKYCKLLSEKLKLFLNKQAIVHYTSSDPRKAANAAFLMGCYGILLLGLSPKDALKPLTMNGSITYRPFQDATDGDSIFTITLLDCLKAIKKARDLGFFNLKDFNYDDYNRLDKIAGGDLNWIVPGKFLAFIGPVDVDYSVNLYHPPEIYMSYFLENDVKMVIRLNKKLYDGDVFNQVGISHHDLFFPDGSCPPRHILFKFLQISENTAGAIAVHCKAGLGRTGSLIGSYLIKHYRMTAREAIGWMRICRPGSVIGHQQGWLEQIESWLTKQGNIYRKKYFNDEDRIPVHKYGVYSIAEKASKKTTGSKILAKGNQSPPPPIQWNTRSEILPPPRPRASKVREAVNKPQMQRDSSTESSKHSFQKPFNKGDQNERSRSTTRRGGDSGERATNPSSYANTRSVATTKTNTSFKGRPSFTNYTSICVRNVKASRPINPSPSPTRLKAADKKNTSVKGKEACNTASRYERLNKLCHALTVTPHNANRVTSTANEKTTAMYSTAASRGSVQSNPRRRLGRSPSPSPARVLEHSRATNTPSTSNNGSRGFLSRDTSKTSLKKALSKLKCVDSPRDGSLGGHSVGAGSLGARRDAPAPVLQRSPRVRSDERTIATQGDMLNSIKFQRRLRNNSNCDEKLDKCSISKNAFCRPIMSAGSSTMRPLSKAYYMRSSGGHQRDPTPGQCQNARNR